MNEDYFCAFCMKRTDEKFIPYCFIHFMIIEEKDQKA